ncbi:MAG: type II toxin-antitoxin system HipA family toxin [Rhodocyclales bacterium]|nr:type II toxin-antitoxin system HipA family toxin [Rhodocyclales bacterium]
MKRLSVIYAGWGERWPLGTLADTGRAGQPMLFEYSAEARREGLELSPLRLPLTQPGAFAGEPFFLGLPGLIADALPDGWGMLLMDRAFSRAGRRPGAVSPLDRLAFIGERAMGALAFEPAEPQALDHQDLTLLQLAKEVRVVVGDTATTAPAEEALRHLLLLGGSPQGARPKVLVNVDPARGKIGMTEGNPRGTGETTADAGGDPWLIKFPAREEHRDACAIEELYARLARHAGLDMPESRFFDLSTRHAAFGVRRFDRKDGLRVPLLSLSALLHVDHRLPALDYEMLLRATRRLTGDEREVHKAFERCVLNVLLHNRDDHSRNFAFRLSADRRWRLAPVFDLTYNEGPGGEHQSSVAGEGRAPARRHLLEVARRGGIDAVAAQKIIDRLLAATTALPTLASGLPIRKTRLAELRRILADDWRRVGDH